MIVLGLDPGIAHFGFGVVERRGTLMKYCDAGVFTTSPKDAVPQRLVFLAGELTQLFTRYQPDRIALERLFPAPHTNFGKVGEVRGVVLLFAGQHRVPVEEISPTTLKAFTTRSGNAGKLQIRKTVQRILGLSALPLSDAADALGLAILGSASPARSEKSDVDKSH